MSVNKVNSDGSLSRVAGGTLYADLAVGSIVPFGGSTAPSGFLLCNGQAVSRTSYKELFASIGVAFGSGDGSTTFNVPDMRGKTLVGYNSSETDFNVIGKTGGEKTHILTVNEMPSHSHSVAPIIDVAGNYGCTPSEGSYTNSSSDYNPTTSTVATGGGQAHNNLQPYNTVNYIIKAKQVAVPSDFKDAIDDAVDDKIKETIIRRDISSATATSSMSYEQAIADVLTRAGVKDFENGIYVGSMRCSGQSPHNWIGMYQVNKMWSGDYGIMVNGNANNILFSATYASNAWEVKVYTSA